MSGADTPGPQDGGGGGAGGVPGAPEGAPASSGASSGAAAVAAAIAAAPEWVPLDLQCARLPRNDFGTGQRLIARSGADLMHVPEVGWHAWMGTHWEREDGERQAHLAAHRAAAAIRAEGAALEAEGPWDGEAPKDFLERISGHRKFGIGVGNSSRLRAMLAEAAPYLTEPVGALDADPFLFACENGTLELRAADAGGVRLRPARRQDRITRLAPVAYDPEAEAPRFRAFLDRILPDRPVQLFLQRYLGYALTGDIGEQCLILCYGTGSNGKSTLLDVIARLLGGYTTGLPMASLMHDDRRRGAEATPDLARLPGMRLVRAAEANQGSRFDEALLKQLTGGEPMAVRHLNAGFFEFYPVFKLVLTFNNRPTIRGQDEGIWRRLRLVPFSVTIPDGEKDSRLVEKLLGEGPGILNWLLDGFRLWRETGLAAPEAVLEATADYRAESDPVGQFLSMATAPAPGRHTSAKRLYDAFAAWCKENAVTPLTQTGFGRRLGDKGLKKVKTGGLSHYEGVELLGGFEDAPGWVPDREDDL